MPKTTAKPQKSKISKPHKDFPLFPHATGRWAKKVRGKHVYFGYIANDPKGEVAIDLWLAQKDDLLAGRVPRVSNGGVTMRELCNRFLTVKQARVDGGELSSRTWQDYHDTCERLIGAFGKDRPVADLAADDFEVLRASLNRNWGPVAVGNEINRTRVLFRYSYEAGLIDRPVRFGPDFRRPSKKTLRIDRQRKGKKLLAPAELRTLIDSAEQPMKAMILLGLNCGFGNSDVGNLPIEALDLSRRWVDFPRPKTAVQRRCPLWPETVEALKAAAAERPKPKDDEKSHLAFVTKYGLSWSKETRDNPVAKEFVKLLKAKKLHRTGLGFYLLRHVFETIGGESRDQVAVNAIMGHADATMAGAYREQISDDRLKAVTDHVRKWLWPAGKVKRAKG